MNKLWIGAASLLVACGGGGGGNKPDAPVGKMDAAVDAPAPSMTINGTGSFKAQNDTALTTNMFDFTMTTITSVTPDGSGFDHRNGMGMNNGTFTVPVGQNAPSWDLSVSFSALSPILYVVGNSMAPDYTQYDFGRVDATAPTASTVVTLNVTGMTAWQATDDMEIMSSNAGSIFFSPYAFFTPVGIAAGSTSVAAKSFDWMAMAPNPPPLIDTTKGDVTVLWQLATTAAKAGTNDAYNALAKMGTATGFTMTNGNPATMTVALTAVPQNETLAVHWKRSQFDALSAQAGPTPALGTTELLIDALPSATMRGFYGFTGAPDVMEFTKPPTGTTDIDETFTYANPFTTMNTAWDEFVILQYQWNIPEKSGTSLPASPAPVGGYFGLVPVASLRGNGATGDLTPQISGVTSFQIGGKDATMDQSAVGTTPMISWSAPAIGTATNYFVEIESVTAANGRTTLTPTVFFQTKATSFQVPDNLLQTGTRYIALVTAYAMPNTDLTVTPFEQSLPEAQFTTISGQFIP